jgi:site-specific DNA recombinase
LTKNPNRLAKRIPGVRAVLYLRVSSTGQVETDYDPEGLSIPAQRASCLRKAAQMGLDVVEEYIEPGVSGREMTKRIAFQSMLKRIRDERDVDYVLVYKLSRMNRNRVDDALVVADLRALGVTLVSATESIDETPAGQLLHGILASYNEFRSAEDGADIRYKMGEKAKRGGTISRAPLGYNNVHENFEGRMIATVALDNERAPLIKVAFEYYATGDYTLDRLQQTMADLGLKTKPTRRWPSQPISMSKLHQMLQDPYYTGVIEYDDVTYPGRHDPIVSIDLF